VEGLAKLKEAHPKLETVRLDVAAPESLAEAVKEVERLTGGRGLDVLVNNAGYGLVAPLLEVDDAKLKEQFEVNVFGLMRVTRAFLPEMMSRGEGRVVNISSVSGRISMPLFGAYHATKWALETLSDSLRMELRPFGVKVIVVEPGTIRTGFVDRAKSEAASVERPDSLYAPVYANLPKLADAMMGQAVGPASVVRAIVRASEAASPRARYVAPFHALLMLWALALLPTWLVDAAMTKMSGLSLLAPKRHD
jgi:NAD(P)-dependent dehydrogenase (short-subunit alcohol dehydrogenase family)